MKKRELCHEEGAGGRELGHGEAELELVGGTELGHGGGEAGAGPLRGSCGRELLVRWRELGWGAGP
jgi:hypothetical protein